MQDKSVNKASIVFAIVILIFILGGVYLLNQSISRSNTSSNESNSTASQQSSSTSPSSNNSPTSSQNSSTSTSTNSSTTSSSKSTDTANPNDENSTVQSTGNTTTLPSTPSQGQTNTTTSPANPSTPKEPTKLAENQLTAKFIGNVEDNQTRWEITACGLPNAKVCVPGARMRLVGVTQYVTPELNKEYKFTAQIREEDGKFFIDVVTKIEPII